MFRVGDYIQSKNKGILAQVISADFKNKIYEIILLGINKQKLKLDEDEMNRIWLLLDTSDTTISFKKVEDCDCGMKGSKNATNSSHYKWCKSLIN